jgi:hypothetical protein
MTEPSGTAAEQRQLGELILGQTPYGTPEQIGHAGRSSENAQRDEPAANGPFQPRYTGEAKQASSLPAVELDGPAAGHFNRPGKRLNAQDLANLRAAPQEGMWWYFDGKPRYVSKAIRVPYTYTLEGETSPRTDYLLIGYEGAGW